MIWIKNTDHQPDAALTFAFVAFIVVVVKLGLNGVSIAIAGSTVNCGVIDAGLIAAMLTPTLGAYCWRRSNDINHGAVEALPPPEAKKAA